MPGDPVWAMGLMCGTSMDGVDAALLRTDGERIAGFGPSLALEPAYNATQRGYVDLAALAVADRVEQGGDPDPDTLVPAEGAVHDIHAAAAIALRARTDEPVGVVGFHGQTVFHAPHLGRTVQLGDGARLAETVSCPVVWDFRSADMRAGGQGAPLAPFYHFALARHIGAAEPLAFLNIGGVANVTWVDPSKAAPEEEGALLAFDTGPGNALLNDWMMRRTGAPLDRDGATAARGRIDGMLLRLNASRAFLERRPPKSLDRNAFALVLDRMDALSTEDGAATLTAFAAECIALSRMHMPAPPARWLVCGGGRRNPVMMEMLAGRLDAPVEPVEAVGLDGDMLEAQAFAYLAVRALRGLPLSAPGTTGCDVPVTGGVLSDPRHPRRGHRPGT